MKGINKGIAKGGKNYYGFPIGILMLHSQFPRIPGEMGNAYTWDFPVLYKAVKGASPEKVVTDLTPSLIEPFVNAAKELEAEGVRAITTNCGFLAMFHNEISSAVNVPVFSSTLMMIPMVYRMLKPGKKVGVLTVNSATLTDRHFDAVGALEIPKAIQGLQDEEEFTNMILEDRLEFDIDKAREEHVRCARKLVEENPDVGAIVLECTNMPPYAKDIQEATGLPVFDITTLVNMVHNALVKHPWKGIM
ncbi:Aspartate/glutamate racemase [Dethiosulfatibacter aminovorans DSM 17477]|uniref:Aspartate/glutamate racemase n=1 Tax=Dethiosulfatibacter aminovorans DSM 17477 TaxID=1121476 RepID=A0A1M6IWL6_9FIRM|nr:aspartate/glutamate racemase family protein [Dethiosulfatibacter aminovorans]SHJ38817.1 Aspartate/glutamate racemase [Dethiosulfatibacter aminovorans DSM 17477]